MNEGDSAGGGHQGSDPAPPAVLDRRSTVASSNANIQIFNSQDNQNYIKPQTIVSDRSAVLSSVNALQHHHHQHSINSRYEYVNILPAQQQQHHQEVFSRIQQRHSQQQQEQQQHHHQQHHNQQIHSNNLNINSAGSNFLRSSSNNNNLVSSSYLNIGGNISRTSNASGFLSASNNSSSSSSSTITNIAQQQHQHQQHHQQQQNSIQLGSNIVENSVELLNYRKCFKCFPSQTNANSASSSPSVSSVNNNSANNNSGDIIGVIDLNTVKKRILEHKLSRLKSLKEKYAENVAELYFLHTGGHMMEYPNWRKKPPTQQFINFTKTFRLDSLVNNEESNRSNTNSQPSVVIVSTSVTTSTTTTTNACSISTSTSTSNSPQGAEIKIPGVGATPVAVSTTLPAAVVQLTQQGGTPIVPEIIPSSLSNTSDKRKSVASSSSISPSSTIHTVTSVHTPRAIQHQQQQQQQQQQHHKNHNQQLHHYQQQQQNQHQQQQGTNNTINGVQEQFSVKAKQEVYVMQRISELQREGLWTERRLPKLQEPSRPKAHWDYLLEEMVWLAADFAQERKWKKSAAKKCAKMVQKYFNDKANAAQKAEKAQELQLKKIAAFIAKEIKTFWSSVEKFVEYKHHTKLEEKRKRALDQHLSFIVDQTEKFSQQLAEGMNKATGSNTLADNSAAPSMTSSRISSPRTKELYDDEFQPESEDSYDDEETIAKAEEEASDVKEELAALKKESEMELDDFIDELPKGYLENRDKIVLKNDDEELDSDDNISADENDREFEANDERSTDDEDTIMEQEKRERNIDYKQELDELNAENEMSLDELLAKYKVKSDDTKMDIDSDSDEHEDDISDNENDDDKEDSDESMDSDEATEGSYNDDYASEDESMNSFSSNTEHNNLNVGLQSVYDSNQEEIDKDGLINDAAAIAESIQPKGNTLSSTNVVTPVPFLLRHTLREYQHIGLDWLVTMHDRKLNGILADEMGLGKTIQTIALLAHLACVKGNWGPHLIVVPSSVMLNWEMEFKKWCPGFKILTYYGVQKERKQKRIGWTKANAFHVCITSYKLVIQDQQSFRRKKWKYLILDEAQNIKNFKSQRWQLLLNFQTEQRLLLTGTPLQNNLMELWSLMHFLMPHVFQSHREFKEWFSNPMTGMIEGNSEYNDSIIKRLHKVLRPFLLRRLKSEVEKQMPKKYEHVVMCRLSKRQRFLYDDFMSRAKTRETLASGNLLSVINVLMQLRKVCNHPNLFEVRPTVSPFRMEGLNFRTSSLVCNIFDYDPFKCVDLNYLNIMLVKAEQLYTAYLTYKLRKHCPSRKLIEEVDSIPDPPRCPGRQCIFRVRVRNPQIQDNLAKYSTGVLTGTSPAMKTDGNKLVPVIDIAKKHLNIVKRNPNMPMKIYHSSSMSGSMSITSSTLSLRTSNSSLMSVLPSSLTTIPASTSAIYRGQLKPAQPSQRAIMNTMSTTNAILSAAQSNINSGSGNNALQIVQTAGRHFVLAPVTSGTVVTPSGQRITVLAKAGPAGVIYQHHQQVSRAVTVPSNNKTLQHSTVLSSTLTSNSSYINSSQLIMALAQQLKNNLSSNNHCTSITNFQHQDQQNELEMEFYSAEREQRKKEERQSNLQQLARINQRRCDINLIYGKDLCDSTKNFAKRCRSVNYTTWHSRSFTNCSNAMYSRDDWSLCKLIKSYEQRTNEMLPIFTNFAFCVPAVSAPRPYFEVYHNHPFKVNEERNLELTMKKELSPKLRLLHPVISAMSTQFPDPHLIQYDCGKLQTLDLLLRKLKREGHRALIFTQMTKMLDVLEAFLNYHGHIYLRLDGTTRIEQRQLLMERFNGDKRIFVFILSTRSGGVGVNLTGADTVIFYDSDWNPTMDAQAQDRCHRIGQTRDVHIYRLISEKTIEENILKKANQKRLLGDLAIEGGNFTAAYFKSSTIHDLFQIEAGEKDAMSRLSDVLDRERKQRLQHNYQSVPVSVIPEEKTTLGVFESALAAAEDEQDVQAAKTAKAEAAADLAEFDENIPIDENPEINKPEMSKVDQELENLVNQLNPIEKYAMRFVEEMNNAWTAEQLRQAELEIEQQRREWEESRKAALQKEQEILKAEEQSDEILTYSREDAKNQVIKKSKSFKNKTLGSIKTRNQKLNEKLRVTDRVSNTKINMKKRKTNNRSGRENSNTNTNTNINTNTNRKRVTDKRRRGRFANHRITKSLRKTRSRGRQKLMPGLMYSGSRGVSKLMSEELVNDGSTIDSIMSNNRNNSGSRVMRKNKIGRNVMKNSVKKSSNVSNSSNQKKLRTNRKIIRNNKKVKRKLNKFPKLNFDSNSDSDANSDSDNDDNNDTVSEIEIDNPNDEDYEAGETTTEMTENEDDVEEDENEDEDEDEGDDDDDDDNNENNFESFSECSLDVMVDTTTNDTNTNSTNCNASGNNSDRRCGNESNNSNNDDDDEKKDFIIRNKRFKKIIYNNDDKGLQKLRESSIMGRNNKKTQEIDNHIDMVNAPRTRSRGSVKINLWTLDVSPILPGVKPIKGNRKNDLNTNSSTSTKNTKNKESSSMVNEANRKFSLIICSSSSDSDNDNVAIYNRDRNDDDSNEDNDVDGDDIEENTIIKCRCSDTIKNQRYSIKTLQKYINQKQKQDNHNHRHSTPQQIQKKISNSNTCCNLSSSIEIVNPNTNKTNLKANGKMNSSYKTDPFKNSTSKKLKYRQTVLKDIGGIKSGRITRRTSVLKSNYETSATTIT